MVERSDFHRGSARRTGRCERKRKYNLGSDREYNPRYRCSGRDETASGQYTREQASNKHERCSKTDTCPARDYPGGNTCKTDHK